MSPETLAPDVAWEPSGHLSEVALSVAADGEYTLFDAAMHEHLASCEACATELGVVALRSADVAEALAAVPALAAKQQAESAPAQDVRQSPPRDVRQSLPRDVRQSLPRARVPVFAIAAALVIAVVGALPSIVTAPAELARGWSVFQKVAPSMLRLAPLAVHRAWSGGGAAKVALMWALAAALLVMGLAIAKRASKKMLLNGGRR